MVSGRTRLATSARLLPESAAPEGATKTASVVVDRVRSAREAAQERARQADGDVEAVGGNRAARDRDRIYPRAGPSEVGRRGRGLLARDEARLPLTQYQSRKLRNTAHAAQQKMPATEWSALNVLTQDQERWEAVNAALSERVDNDVPLDLADEIQVQRLDRAIRRAENANDRRHRVYAGLAIDTPLPANQLANLIHQGELITFDQFTLANHNPAAIDPEGSSVILEIETSRGMFAGGPTNHLLPRGIALELVNVSDEDIIGPNGPTERRTIIQAREVQQP